VCFALYPVLWVVSLALSPSGTPSFRAIPLPEAASLVNFREVLGATTARGSGSSGGSS
jgi:arabinogalactan oligomer/maltooligosaccharide transport system permease protein